MLELAIRQKCCRVVDVNWIDITKFCKVSQFESILPKKIQVADNARDKDPKLQINVRTGPSAFIVDLMNLVAYFRNSADLDDMDSDVASHLSRVFVQFFLSWRRPRRTRIRSGRPHLVLLLWCRGTWTLLFAFRRTILRFNHFQKTGGFTLPSGSIQFQAPSQFRRISLEK